MPPESGHPRDIELMQYFDGELDEPRRSEVAAFLVHSEGRVATDKLASLARVSEIVRVQTDAIGTDFDIADAIMARIESGDLGSDVEVGAPEVIGAAEVKGEAGVKGDAALAEPKHAPVGSKPVEPLNTKAPARAAANDNSRRIFGMAALAAVAAGILLWWGSSGDDVEQSARAPKKTDVAEIDPAPSGVPAPPPLEQVAELEPVDREGPGVEVAAVDFGTSNGSVFYVPNDDDADGAQTTVVWLASADGDTANGEK